MAMKKTYRDKIFERYVESYNEIYDKSDLEKEMSYRHRRYEINYAHLLPMDKASRILEMGCGPGYFLRFLADRGYANHVGVDFSRSQVMATGAAGASNVILADLIEYLKSVEGGFEMIFSFHVLEHMEKDDILELLELAWSRLAKNGRIVIEVPNAGSPFIGGQGRYGEFTHEVGFTASSLAEILVVSGFKDVKTYPIRVPSLLSNAFFWAANRLYRAAFKQRLFVDGEIMCVGVKG